ncbi:MAG TPA: hypothetical protein VI112_05290 [Bacteroidia bacterium]|jgi:hypothetical protein
MKLSKLIFIFYALALLPLPAHAQKDSVADNQSKFSVSVLPLSFLEASGGRCARVGIEYKLVKRFSHYIDYSYYFPNGWDYSGMSGFRVRTDLRYYFKGDSSFFSFVGFSFLYKDQRMLFHGSIIDQPNDGSREINFDFTKTVYTADIVFGNTKKLYKHFFLGYEGGLGMRYRNMVSGLTQTQLGQLVYPDGLHMNSFPDVDLTIDIVASFKLVYRIL